MVDPIFLGAGIVVAVSGGALIAAAPRYASEMERYADDAGPIGLVLLPPFVPKARARAYLLWSARVGGSIIAVVGLLFATSALRVATP